MKQDSLLMRIVGNLHKHFVMPRRAETLARELAQRLPIGAKVLDVGAGSMEVGSRMCMLRPDLHLQGIDVVIRPEQLFHVVLFDGILIPHCDDEFDYCILVDVLHHADEPKRLISESYRVARRGIIIKDHCCQGALDRMILSIMDWVGNAPHGVALPYNYLGRAEWRKLLQGLGGIWREDSIHPGIYPRYADWFFGGHLQVIFQVEKHD